MSVRVWVWGMFQCNRDNSKDESIEGRDESIEDDNSVPFGSFAPYRNYHTVPSGMPIRNTHSNVTKLPLPTAITTFSLSVCLSVRLSIVCQCCLSMCWQHLR